MEGPTPQLATKRSLVPGVLFFFSLVPGARWYPTLKPRLSFCMWYIIPHTKTKIIPHVHTCTKHTGTRGRIFFWYVSIRNSLRVRACAQTTATAAPDCNTSSSSSSVASRRWSRVLALQRVNPALAIAVGRMFHTAAVTLTLENMMQFLFIISIDKHLVYSRRDLIEGVAPCSGF